MKLSQYGYDFAPETLARYPADNRDESRLMVIDRAKGVSGSLLVIPHTVSRLTCLINIRHILPQEIP